MAERKRSTKKAEKKSTTSRKSSTARSSAKKAKKAKKPAKKAVKKGKPTTGQSAPKREITLEMLNDNEDAVLDVLYAQKGAATIAQIAEALGSADNKGKLRVRNAIRRLVQGDWVERSDRATYSLSKSGRSRLRSYYRKAKAA